MRTLETRWAALVPWGGIQDIPALIARISADGIQISDVEGLAAALAAGGGSGTVAWSAITGKPAFGSAARSDASDFATAAQGVRADTALQPADVVGTAGEVDATPGVGSSTISLPAALAFTGKTIAGGAFDPESLRRLITGVQALSGPGAVNLTDFATDLTTTGVADALTLADGSAGLLKVITHVVDGGSAILTPATALGFTTITFTNVNESVLLRWTAAGWAIVSLYGAVAA